MAGKYGYEVSMDDVRSYTEAVETMYGVHITLELAVAARGLRGAWSLNARAWVPGLKEQKQSLMDKMVVYPSVHYSSFPGAALAAVTALESQLQGWYWLQQMQGLAAE